MPLFALIRAAAGALGYLLIPTMVSLPWTFWEAWVVAPGAFLGALAVQAAAPGRPGRGAALGAVMGVLNAPVSVLVALAVFHLATPWKYGFGALLEEWVRSLPLLLLWGAPVALPCGALLGAAVARAARPRD